MFLFFKGVTQPTPTGLFQQMKAASDAFLSTQKKNFNPIQVKAQVPRWVNDTAPNFVKFIQSYYDWMVDSYGYTGVNITDMANLFDIDESPEFLLPNFIKSYAPDLIGIYDLGLTLQPTPEQIRRTITNVKTEVYQRKSNEDAFRTLMLSLFGITANTTNISYPKRKLMRLNAGRLDWMPNSEYYGITGEYSPERYTMVGSYLNQGVLQDGKMWQDFSYVLTSEVDDSNPYYEAVVKETLHPAGLLGIYEKLEKYSEGGFVPEPPLVYEEPAIAYYYPYDLTMSVSLPKCTGCTGSLAFTGWYYPTFVYPDWDDEIAANNPANFGEIQVYDFFKLRSSTQPITPNDYIGISCTAACTFTGDADFYWLIGDTQDTSGIPIGGDDTGSEDFFFYDKDG